MVTEYDESPYETLPVADYERWLDHNVRVLLRLRELDAQISSLQAVILNQLISHLVRGHVLQNDDIETTFQEILKLMNERNDYVEAENKKWEADDGAG